MDKLRSSIPYLNTHCNRELDEIILKHQDEINKYLEEKDLVIKVNNNLNLDKEIELLFNVHSLINLHNNYLKSKNYYDLGSNCIDYSNLGRRILEDTLENGRRKLPQLIREERDLSEIEKILKEMPGISKHYDNILNSDDEKIY